MKLVKKGVLFCAPFLLFSVAVTLASIWVFQNFIGSSSYFDAITLDPNFGQNAGDLFEDAAPSTTQSSTNSEPNESGPSSTQEWSEGPAPAVPEQFPVLAYGKKWATLNVEGWNRKDVSVIFGSNTTLLKKGACMSMKSSFCGKGGRTILSAHVNSYFWELEDVQMGQVITVDTVYGRYRYEVINRFIFDYRDTEILYTANNDEENILFLYTCYPRKNPYAFKDERYAVVARMIEGKDWRVDTP